MHHTKQNTFIHWNIHCAWSDTHFFNYCLFAYLCWVLIAARWLYPVAVASRCRAQALEYGLSNCGARALLPCGMLDLPGPGIKRVPYIVGRHILNHLTTGLIQGSSRNFCFICVFKLCYSEASLVAQMVKNSSALQDTQIQFLDQEDSLEKGMTILAWRIPWIEDLGGLQSMRS